MLLSGKDIIFYTVKPNELKMMMMSEPIELFKVRVGKIA